MVEWTHLRSRAERVVGPACAALPPGLRVVAAASVCLILYSYLGGLWLNRHGYSPGSLVLVRAWVNKPAGVGEDFGVLGIAMLLIVVGFLAGVASTRTVAVLLTRLPLLVLPAVFVTVSASGLLLAAGGQPLTEPPAAEATPGAYVAGLLLLDRFAGQPALMPLTWPLMVAAVFLLTLLAFRPLSRHPLLAVSGQVAALGVVVWLGSAVDATAGRELGLLAGFAPLAVLGEVLWLVHARRVAAWPAGAAAVGAGAVMTIAERLYQEWDGWWYPLTALYAVLIVLIALPAGTVLGATLPVRWLASRALWLTLCCGVVGYGILGLQYQRVPLPVALCVTVLATAGAAEAGHRWIQRPLGRLADRLAPARPGEVA